MCACVIYHLFICWSCYVTDFGIILTINVDAGYNPRSNSDGLLSIDGLNDNNLCGRMVSTVI